MSKDLIGKTIAEVLCLHSNLCVRDTITESGFTEKTFEFAKRGRGLGFLS